MAIHISISHEEAADHLALRELLDANAHCADRRASKGQIALFTEDTRFVVYMDAKSDIPSQEFKKAAIHSHPPSIISPIRAHNSLQWPEHGRIGWHRSDWCQLLAGASCIGTWK